MSVPASNTWAGSLFVATCPLTFDNSSRFCNSRLRNLPFRPSCRTRNAHLALCVSSKRSSSLKTASNMPAASNGHLVPHPFPEVSESGILPDGSAKNSFDYIIVGAGCAGSALASRLSTQHPDRSVLLVEAGPNPSYHPLVPQPLVAPMLRGSELDWKYESIPQVHLAKRPIYEAAGRALGGGSVINYGKALGRACPQPPFVKAD